ncbi:MAG: FecR family protein [Bacteroidales bacterium]|nr:FecR family protein [Bacteroidales bacterium]
MSTFLHDMDPYRELIIRYLANDLPEEEYGKLREWINQDNENRKLFSEMLTAWQLSASMESTPDENLPLSFEKLKSRLAYGNNESQNNADNFRRFYFRRAVSVAAAILIAFVLGGLATWYFFSAKKLPDMNAQTYNVTTPYGTRSELSLADGTRVWLNAGSSLAYSENFNVTTREVKLIGEAYFQVAKNKEIPFVVKSDGLQIKALGTAFNVKAYPGDEELSTTLIEGKIVVEGKSLDEGRFSYTLNPGQNIKVIRSVKEEKANQANIQDRKHAADEMKPIRHNIKTISLESDVNTLLYTSWKDKRWVIQQESFSNLVTMLERRYNVNIRFNQAEMEGISFSGIIENETLEQVIHIIQLTAPVNYEFGKGEVNITLDKNRLGKFHMLPDAR